MAKLGKEARKRRGREPKVAALEELNQLFTDGDGVVFMDNNGLTVAEMEDFRNQLREAGVRVKIAKNTLIKRSLEAQGVDADAFEPVLHGPTMLAVGLEDAVSPAKKVTKFLEDNEDKVTIKGGLLENKYLDLAGVAQLSKLPGREELIGSLLGSLNAPAQNMCYALNAAVSQLAWGLNALKTKLEEEG